LNATESYFETLFAQRPAGTLIAVSAKDRGWATDFYDVPAEAAAACLGAVDVFARITPLRARPPKQNGTRGRGDADLSAALPAVWVELDVRGTPNGRGGVKEEGFETIEDATAAGRSVWDKPLIVSSGGGVHLYVVLEQPFAIHTEADLAHASDLVLRYQAAVKRAAGDVKIDSTGDLARVLRPPGTFNHKGDKPRRVTALSNGEATGVDLETLRRLLPPLEDAGGSRRPKKTTRRKATGETDRARELLAEFATLARIVKHRSSKPQDTSPSGWDHMLACRAIDLGVTDDADLAVLLRHHRSTLKDENERAKGERPDYIERTIAKARQSVGPPVASHADILPQLTKRMRMATCELKLADVQVMGDGGRTKFIASDGRLMVFDRLDDVSKPDHLADKLSGAFAVVTELTKLQARAITALVRQYVGPAIELQDEIMLAGWVIDMLDDASAREFRDDDPASKYVVWQEMYGATPTGREAQTFASEMVVAVEQATGDRYIRKSWLQDYIALCGSKDSPGRVRDHLLGIGLQERGKDGQVKATSPQSGESRRLRFYIAPEAWIKRWEGPS
jgi:hypothetical protein